MAKQREELLVRQRHQEEAKEKAIQMEKNEFIHMVKDVLSRSYHREVDAEDLARIYERWENTDHKPRDYVSFKRYILAILKGLDESKEEHTQETLSEYLDILSLEDHEDDPSDPEFKKNVKNVKKDEEEGHAAKKGWFAGIFKRGGKRKTRSRKTRSRKTRSRRN